LRSWLPGFLVGLLASTIAAFVHANRVRVLDQLIYYGLVLAPLFLLATQRWVMQNYRNRISGIAFFIAWLIVTVRLAIPNSSGDFALGDNWFSTVYLGVGALVLSMSMVISPKAKLTQVPAE
jgi:hypothetical protein